MTTTAAIDFPTVVLQLQDAVAAAGEQQATSSTTTTVQRSRRRFTSNTSCSIAAATESTGVGGRERGRLLSLFF
jgi:hypothetical protein